MAAARQRGEVSALSRLNVTIANRQRTRPVDSSLLRSIVKCLLTDLKIPSADLAIHLVASPEMTRLNDVFLRHTGSTDVITFDYAESTSSTAKGTGCKLHGDILICVDEAVSQARRFHTTWQSELARYSVHGILHLLGFDDLKPAARRKMKITEARCLRRLARRFPLTRLARRRAAS